MSDEKTPTAAPSSEDAKRSEADRAAEPTGEPRQALELTINPDGTVSLEGLPEDLAEIVRALDPDALLACELPASPAGEDAQKEGAPPGEEPGGARE